MFGEQLFGSIYDPKDDIERYKETVIFCDIGLNTLKVCFSRFSPFQLHVWLATFASALRD